MADSWRKLLISSVGGAALTLAGVVITSGTNYVTEERAQVVAQKAKAEELRLAERKAEMDARRATCEVSYAYLQDEKPNLSISEDDRSAVAKVVVNNLRECALRPSADAPSPSPERAER